MHHLKMGNVQSSGVVQQNSLARGGERILVGWAQVAMDFDAGFDAISVKRKDFPLMLLTRCGCVWW